MFPQRYVVKKGDCLWDLADRFLGSPWEWPRIWKHNNQESITQLTGRAIPNPDRIYPNQVLYIPELPNSPKPQPKPQPTQKTKPKSLNAEVSKISRHFATAYKLEDWPMMIYEDALVKATIKLAGKIAVRLAGCVPLIHATNRGLETTYYRKTENAVQKLFLDEAKVEWNNNSNKITYRCLLVSNSNTPSAPSTAIGLAVASDKPVPVLRGEIRFPKLKGRIDRHVYIAENVRVVIEVEPKVPPVAKRPDELQFDHRQVFDHRQAPVTHRTPNTSGSGATWILIGSGVALLTVTILTDFLGGVGIADDVVTIPAALRMIGTGAARLIFPVVVRRVALSGAYVGAGMALKAAH